MSSRKIGNKKIFNSSIDESRVYEDLLNWEEVYLNKIKSVRVLQ